MQLITLGSSSAGNCYLFTNNKETLVLEAGVPFKSIKKAVKYDISKIVGCVVSHRHADHAFAVRDIAYAGIDVLANKDVIEHNDLTHHYKAHVITSQKGYQLGGFKIFAFDVVHDVPTQGFVIEHDDMGRLLFVTDTMLSEYTINGLNHIMVEANYDDDTLIYNIENGITPQLMRDRLLHSHMEFKNTVNLLSANDLTKVSEIILIHLSDSNSDSRMYLRTIQSKFGIPTYIANNRLKLDLYKM